MPPVRRLKCLFRTCPVRFKSQHGRTYHIRAVHTNSNVRERHNPEGKNQERADSEDEDDNHTLDLAEHHAPVTQRIEHPHLTGMCSSFTSYSRLLNHPIALPCDSEGNFLPPGAPPPPQATALQGDWTPFDSGVQFKLAELLYVRAQVSAANIDTLLEIWAQSLAEADGLAPFESHQHMYATIDASVLGDVPWQCLVTGFSGTVDDGAPEWMRTSYEVWYRDPDAVITNMLSNPDFVGQFDLRPYIDLNADGERRWGDFMSGNIAWRHSASVRYCNISSH